MSLALTLNISGGAWGMAPPPDSPARSHAPSATKADKEKRAVDTEKEKTGVDTMKAEVTLSGCLVGPGAGAGPYKLTHATPIGAVKENATAHGKTKKDASQKEASAKETMKGASADAGISYELVGAGSDLKPHVGHRVEVTGTVHHDQGTVDKSSPGTPATGQSTQADQRMAKSGMKPEKVNVTSVKMISATCP
jgi:hypothetical protein